MQWSVITLAGRGNRCSAAAWRQWQHCWCLQCKRRRCSVHAQLPATAKAYTHTNSSSSSISVVCAYSEIGRDFRAQHMAARRRLEARTPAMSRTSRLLHHTTQHCHRLQNSVSTLSHLVFDSERSAAQTPPHNKSLPAPSSAARTTIVGCTAATASAQPCVQSLKFAVSPAHAHGPYRCPPVVSIISVRGFVCAARLCSASTRHAAASFPAPSITGRSAPASHASLGS